MTDTFRSIQEQLETAMAEAREEGRQAGHVAGYEQGWERGFAFAMNQIKELAENAQPPAKPGAPEAFDLFSAAASSDRKRRKRGENNDIIISALNRAGVPLGASDLRRVIAGSDGVDIPYSSIRHSLLGLKDKGLVTVENDLWSVVEEEPI